MSKIKICLDAGHYGSQYNQSPEVNAYYESEMAWKLHLFLKAELEGKGFEVVCTRENQKEDLAVYQRGARGKNCDCFLSLHSNACATESVDYTVVYRAFDNLNGANEVALKLATGISKVMGNVQEAKTATRKTDSGSEYYGVMRGARAVNCPLYLLLEHSFHSNKKASLWLLEEENLKKLAKVEADILGEYYGVSATKEEEVVAIDESNFTAIMGASMVSASQMKGYLLSVNPQASDFSELADVFLAEGLKEGVRGDIAFAQSLVETGNFKFGGDVSASQHNFSGLGTTGNGVSGNSFDTAELGVRAQIQHLKAYASVEELKEVCVDTRFNYVERNCAPYVEWLGIQENPQGKGWASGENYGSKILAILEKMQSYEVSETVPETVPLWMKDSVDWMVEKELFVGDEDGNLRVHDPITRGEFAVVLKKFSEGLTWE